jgi:hypothetical protein
MIDRTAAGVSEEERALEALRTKPAEFLKSTHRDLPFGFSKPRPDTESSAR